MSTMHARTPVVLLLLTLLAACSSTATGPRDPSARFYACEHKLLKADAVRVGFHIKSTGFVASDLKGELILASGNRLDLVADGTFVGEPAKLRLRSDGKRMVGSNGRKGFDMATPSHLNQAVVVGMTRMGLLHNLARLAGGAPPDRAEGTVTEWITVDSFAGDEPLCTFDLSVAGAKTASCILRMGTGDLPVQRGQEVRFREGDMKVQERYTSFGLGETVAAERFIHP